MKTATKKTKPRPTYAEVTEQLDNLRRKVWLLRKKMEGEAASHRFTVACGIGSVWTPKELEDWASVLGNCTIGLDYILQGEES